MLDLGNTGGLSSLTQIRPLQCLGRQANFEPTLILVKLCGCQTGAVHADRVSNVAVAEDGRSIFKSKGKALGRVLRRDGRDVCDVLDLLRGQESAAWQFQRSGAY